jgi:hypothetical protein
MVFWSTGKRSPEGVLDATDQAAQGEWEDLFATRTRGDVGEGLGSILALSTATDLISFSGGFPDPPRSLAPFLLRS